MPTRPSSRGGAKLGWDGVTCRRSGQFELRISENQIPVGTRSLSIFLVNNRTLQTKEKPDKAFTFQPELEVQGDRPFVPRPDLRGVND